MFLGYKIEIFSVWENFCLVKNVFLSLAPEVLLLVEYFPISRENLNFLTSLYFKGTYVCGMEFAKASYKIFFFLFWFASDT
jgi:hypothetical protein